MKRSIALTLALTLSLFILAACSFSSDKSAGSGSGNSSGYEMISQDEAKRLIDTEKDYIILDVRTDEEFADGHIENAILIPDYEISQKAESILKNKNQLILVYCRSGRRSKNAASELAALGYTNVKEFGGIIDWKYGTVKD